MCGLITDDSNTLTLCEILKNSESTLGSSRQLKNALEMFCNFNPFNILFNICSCGSVVEHCVNSAKVVGSIPREHTY